MYMVSYHLCHSERIGGLGSPQDRGRFTLQITTSRSVRPSPPNTRRYRAISSSAPVAFLGLSDSFTAGRPLAAVALQTSEMARRPSSGCGAQPSKSLVRLV